MYIEIIGLTNYDYLDLCAILGNGWGKIVHNHDDLIDVSVNTELVELKINNDEKIWLYKGSKIADIEKDHFARIEIM